MKKDINTEKEKSNSSPRILLRDLFRCGYAYWTEWAPWLGYRSLKI